MAIEKLFFAELQRIDSGYKKILVKALIRYNGEAVFSKNGKCCHIIHLPRSASKR